MSETETKKVRRPRSKLLSDYFASLRFIDNGPELDVDEVFKPFEFIGFCDSHSSTHLRLLNTEATPNQIRGYMKKVLENIWTRASMWVFVRVSIYSPTHGEIDFCGGSEAHYLAWQHENKK